MSESNTAPASAPVDATSTPTDAQPSTSASQSNAKGSDNAKPNSISDVGEQALKKYKVKVDGAEMEVDEGELVKGYQLSKASYNKMTEAAKKEKAVLQREERLKRETDKVLSEMGIDPLKFAEDYILKIIEQEKLTPEQRALKEKEDRIRQLEAEQKQTREQKEQQEFAEMQSKVAVDLENQFMKTFKDHGLEMTPYTVKRMAEKYYLALDDGIENPDLNLLCELVTEDLETDLQKTMKRLPVDKLLKFVGDDVLKHIREADLARLKNPPSATNRPNAPVVPKNRPTEAAPEAKPKSIYDFREQLEQLKKQQ